MLHNIIMNLFQKKEKRTGLILFLFFLCTVGFFLVPTTSVSAGKNYKPEKRIASVKVEEADSLWSIASDYYTEECGSMQSYIAEIKKTNQLSGDVIYAGSYLIIPYYVYDLATP